MIAMHPESRRSREGFTLLEVLLASVIGLLLMGGLYVALDAVLRQVYESRAVAEQASLERALINRLTLDVMPALTPITVRRAAAAPNATTGTTNTTGSTSSTTPPGTGDASSGDMPTMDEPTEDTSGPTSNLDGVPFCAGVKGTATTLSLFVVRVPEFGSLDSAVSLGGDIRRITYWMSPSESGGLARIETLFPTADSASGTGVPTNDETSYVIAPEVKSIGFEYFDGSSWQQQWDGDTLGPDQKTPMGPPRAIRITLELELKRTTGDGVPQRKTIRHVIALPSAGNYQQPEQQPMTEQPETGEPATTGTGS